MSFIVIVIVIVIEMTKLEKWLYKNNEKHAVCTTVSWLKLE